MDAIKKEPFEDDEDDIAENQEEINVDPMSLSSHIKTETQINGNNFEWINWSSSQIVLIADEEKDNWVSGKE